MNIDIEEVEKLINEVKKSLKEAPEGSLRIARNHGIYQYYVVTEKGDTKGRYIRKKEQDYVAALAQKDYDIRLLKELEKMREAHRQSEKLLKKGDWTETKVRTSIKTVAGIYEELNEARKLLVEPRLLSDEEFIKRWLSEEYSGKAFADNAPEIYTERGERVRSKSEKMIADKLYMMGIPYKYESPFYINGFGTVYPDFMLLNIQNRKEIIFEHLGMMDNAEYATSAIKKINMYQSNRLVLGETLLVSFETGNNPVNIKNVENMVKGLVK